MSKAGLSEILTALRERIAETRMRCAHPQVFQKYEPEFGGKRWRGCFKCLTSWTWRNNQWEADEE